VGIKVFFDEKTRLIGCCMELSAPSLSPDKFGHETTGMKVFNFTEQEQRTNI